MTTEVTVQDEPGQNRLEARLPDGRVAGYAHYRSGEEGVLVFDHTVVEDEFEGEGVGSRLAAGVIAHARDNGVRIVPQCSFIRHHMREHEETHDLLAEGARLD